MTTVISGDGSHFCAGLDLSELVARDIHSGVLHSRLWHAAFDAIQFGSVPVVAALHGAVVGGGLELAAARIPRLIGVARMTDLMMTGRVFDADEGQQLAARQAVQVRFLPVRLAS